MSDMLAASAGYERLTWTLVIRFATYEMQRAVDPALLVPDRDIFMIHLGRMLGLSASEGVVDRTFRAHDDGRVEVTTLDYEFISALVKWLLDNTLAYEFTFLYQGDEEDET